ncbi:hypothetical protein QTL86_18585 [Cellulosilyticum sp. ST5]|uniref:hypothetical protein n=1 Tax=Cellulosilyticum sp. ST5 TaxID=3055805 RepID=UPI003977E14B
MKVVENIDQLYLKENVEYNRQQLKEEYIGDTEILQQLGFNTGKENSFNAHKWFFYNEYARSNSSIDFGILYDMKKTGIISKNEINMVKCYALDLIDKGYANTTVSGKVRILSYIIHDTSNFKINIIKGEEGENLLEQVLEERIENNVDIGSIRDYFWFLEYNNVLDEKSKEVAELLNDIEFEREDYRRDLPSNKDILSFEYYIKKFYQEETNEVMRYFFFPVLLWWKITNIIPMRPSEFTCRIKKDCLVEEDGDFYLVIDRVKRSRIRNKRDKPRLPFLSKIKITEEIYKLIEEYQKLTEFDSKRKTLLSYEGERVFSKELIKRGVQVVEHKEERYIDTYVIRDLNTLINSFYEAVIINKYNYNQVRQRLKPGDTRHLAFCSLMLQGVPPIEIALLGGHTHLISQNHYVGHAKYYIESEILDYVSSRTAREDISIQGLKTVIFTKSLEPPIALEKLQPTDDGVGYCTVDLSQEIDVCESDRTCILCSKWWCLPTNHSYVKTKEYIESNCIQPLEDMLKNEEELLRKLLKENRLISVAGLEELEKKYEEEIKNKTMIIKSRADEILSLRKKLIDLRFNEEVIKRDKTNEKRQTIWLDQEQK